MIAKFSITAVVALAALSLGGCVSDYAYRDGPGDYYYGRPSVDYSYYGYGAPYGSIGYGSGYGGYGSIGYSYGGAYDGAYGYPYVPYSPRYAYPSGYGYRQGYSNYPAYRGHGRHGDGYGYGYGGSRGDGHRQPDRSDNGSSLPYYNRDVHGADRIPGIIERNGNLRRPDGGDRGRVRDMPQRGGAPISIPRGWQGGNRGGPTSLSSPVVMPRGRMSQPPQPVAQPAPVRVLQTQPFNRAPVGARSPSNIRRPASQVEQ